MPRVYTGSYLMLPRSKKYRHFVESLQIKDGKQVVDRFQYGYKDHVRAFAREIVGMAAWAASHGEPGFEDVRSNTELCEPLVYFDGKTIDVTGVVDYDSSEQVGTFRMETAKGLLEIPNVHSYTVFIRWKGRYLACLYRWQPEADLLNDVIVSAIVKEGGKFNWVLFKGAEQIKSLKDVDELEYVPTLKDAFLASSSRRGFVILAKEKQPGLYGNYLFDVNELAFYQLDDSSGSPSWAFQEERRSRASADNEGLSLWWHDSELRNRYGPLSLESPASNEDKVTFLLHVENSKMSLIVQRYISNADKVEVIPNLFADDQTINLAVTYVNRAEDARFLYYCFTKEPSLFCHAIYGIGIDELERGAENHWLEYQSVYRYSPEAFKHLKLVVRDLYKLCGEAPRRGLLPERAYRSCCSQKAMSIFMGNYFGSSLTVEQRLYMFYHGGKQDFRAEKRKYDELFQEIASEGTLNPRWKGEYTLFQIIQSVYPDAIFQYHSSWLGNQSLDIFVPSISTGFEYQGQQHYQAIELFGGEHALFATQERDRKKRQLCEENNVLLIEWRFDEPLSALVLKRKLEAREIDTDGISFVEPGNPEKTKISKKKDGSKRKHLKSTQAKKERLQRKDVPEEYRAPIKRAKIREVLVGFRRMFPDATYADIVRITGISRPTINKYLGKPTYRGCPKC